MQFENNKGIVRRTFILLHFEMAVKSVCFHQQLFCSAFLDSRLSWHLCHGYTDHC